MRLLLILLVLGLTACNGANEKDPLADKPSNIKNGVAPDDQDKPQVPKTQIVLIGLDPFFELSEGVERVIPLNIRVTDPDFEITDIVVENLDSRFPGATFDPVEEQITWTPPTDFVPGGSFVKRIPLEVTVYGVYGSQPINVKASTSVNVLKGNMTPPQITNVEGFSTEIKELGAQDVVVTVRDDVSSNGPTLAVIPYASIYSNGTSFVEMPVAGVRDSNDPSLWHFRGKINLRQGIDITDRKETFGVGFVAYSVFGASTSISKQNFTVLTNIAFPVFFADSNKKFKLGGVNSYSFSIVDPKQEGVVQGSFTSSCNTGDLAGAQCTCDFLSRSYTTCTINWVPQNTGTFNVNLEAFNNLTISGITYERKSFKTIQIEVVN